MNRGAQTIERIRVTRGWTNAQLAEQIGVDAPLASRLRRGVFLPNLVVAVRIRDRLGIDPAAWHQDPDTSAEKVA